MTWMCRSALLCSPARLHIAKSCHVNIAIKEIQGGGLAFPCARSGLEFIEGKMVEQTSIAYMGITLTDGEDARCVRAA